MPGDPLFDTLFRPTVATPAIASAAPIPTQGTRSRGGNTMSRTRAAILEGARRAVEISGTRITMSQIAAAAGVAKATLYNHFRTREAVLDALLLDEVTAFVERLGGTHIADALPAAATAISEHPLLRALSRVEPATLAALARVDPAAEGWRLAATTVESALRAEGRGGADLVLRWLASHIVSPSTSASIGTDVELLLVALPRGLPRPAGSEPSTSVATELVTDLPAQSA